MRIGIQIINIFMRKMKEIKDDTSLLFKVKSQCFLKLVI